jgi:hypothetical protein
VFWHSLTMVKPLIEVRLKAAYKATTGGKFSEALGIFQNIIHTLLFIVVDSKKEANEVRKAGVFLNFKRQKNCLVSAGNT